VHTKAQTLKSKGGDASKLINTLRGLNAPNENINSLKYGRNMEHVAKKQFLQTFLKEHKNAEYREYGLFIDEQNQFIGATPDLLLECAWHGKGLLEIKCPYSVANDIPTPENLSYLVNDNDNVTLKTNYQYYTQVQGQMAVTKRNWCYFYVYTQKGHHLEKIDFNPTLWESIKQNIKWVYSNYMII